MTTRTTDQSIIDQTISRAPTAIRANGPTLLIEAECDHVAAAGGRPTGGGGGDVRCHHPAGLQ